MSNSSVPVNSSGIRPTGHRILVRPDPVEEITSGGIVLPADTARREQLRQVWGTLIACGPAAWAEHAGEREAPGARIMFGAYSGLIHKGRDGIEYRIINDRDVCAAEEFAP